MNSKKEHIKSQLLQRIADYLVINGSFTSSPGLYHGKMGIILFFVHYARYSGQTLYDDFAGELLDEIYDDIHIGINIDFENGLSGIGWGIEYLVQNGFMEGDTSEILEEVDLLIMEKDPLRIRDNSLEKGLAGMGYYVAYHIGTKSTNSTVMDAIYLENLTKSMNKTNFRKENKLSEKIAEFYRDGIKLIATDIDIIPSLLLKNTVEIENNTDLSILPLGICNGMSGVGLKLMIG